LEKWSIGPGEKKKKDFTGQKYWDWWNWICFYMNGTRRKIIRLRRTAFDRQYSITPPLHHSMVFQPGPPGQDSLLFLKGI
jgi:hypothetical protein